MNNDAIILFLRDFSSLIVELLSAIIGTIFYYKYRNSVLKYFLIYLWFIVFIEYFAYIAREYFGIYHNAWLINTFYIISFTYLFSLYRSVVKNKRKKLMIKYSAIIYVGFSIVNVFFENYIERSQTIPFIIGSSLLILSILFYFVEILGTEKVLHVKKNLLFWISTGLLLFYAGIIPFRITINYYAGILGKHNPIYSILFILIIISNICYIIGFIWSSKKQLY